MKISHGLLICSVLALALTAQAEDKAGKKTMVFQPGAKVPDGHTPEPAATTVANPAAAAVGDVDAKSAEAPIKFVSQFFTLLQKGDVDAAYDGLIRGSKIIERPEESKALRAKTREAIQAFGAVVGFEKVESKNVGERLLRLTYMSLGKEFPLRWRFYFYNPGTTWRLVDLRVDDRLSGMFEESEEVIKAPAKP